MQRKAFYLLSGLIGLALGVVLFVLADRIREGYRKDVKAVVQQTVRNEIAAANLKNLKADIAATVQKLVRRELEKDAYALNRQRKRIAALQSAAFVDKHMPKTPAFRDLFALLEHSLKAVPTDRKGLYCEFGVYKGTTINFIASKVKNTIHGFDSFEGLPETWRTGFSEGTFQLSNLPKVKSNVRLHKGWFDKSLPVWAKEHPGPVLFMHLDADLYSSTKTVLDILGDRVVKGTVLQFDEYFNYPGWKEGEYKAFMEFVKQRNVHFEYIGYTYRGNAQQVAVQITGIHTVDKTLSAAANP